MQQNLLRWNEDDALLNGWLQFQFSYSLRDTFCWPYTLVAQNLGNASWPAMACGHIIALQTVCPAAMASTRQTVRSNWWWAISVDIVVGACGFACELMGFGDARVGFYMRTYLSHKPGPKDTRAWEDATRIYIACVTLSSYLRTEAHNDKNYLSCLH